MVIFTLLPEIFLTGMVIKYAFLLSILTIPFTLSGQDTTFILNAKRNTVISFHQSEASLYSNGNAILIQLATALDENPWKVKIGVGFTELLQVRTYSMKNPEVTIRVAGVYISKAPSYRSFPMAEALIPDLVSCNLNLIDLPDSNILRQYRLTNMDVDQLAAGYTSSEIPVMVAGKFSVTLSDIILHYSDKALGRFRERIQTINDYFASASLTDSLLEVANRYNPLTTSDLPDKYILLMEINRIVRLIGDHRFREKLSLDKHDPEQFASKFLNLDKFSRSATMTFEQQLASPALLDWTGSLNHLSETYILHLISYIHKSMLLNGIRGGIYRKYLDSWFGMAGFSDEELIFNDLLRKMYPGEDPSAQLPVIAQTVWDAYLQGARRLIEGSEYVEASMLLRHASSFRERIPVVLKPDCKPMEAEAVKGIYASYLGIAESCMDLQKFRMAEDYIDQAGEYLAEYRSIIPVDTMFQRVFRKLFNRRLQGCDYLLGEKQYQEALECYQLFSLSYPPEMISYVEDHLKSGRQKALSSLYFEEREMALSLMRRQEEDSALVHFDNACRYAEQITGAREISAAQEELVNRMLPVRYEKLAGKGTYYYLLYNHEEAFRTFSQMKEVGEKLGIPVDTALNHMYLESYKHHMLNEISMATGMIWKDELELAKEYAHGVETVMDLFNLESDPDLQSALSSYRSKIDLKACLAVKEESENLSVRAWRNIELKQFDVALRQLGDARQKALQHPECKIDLTAYNDTIKKYISAAFYQEKQQQARNQVAMGNFREAILLVSDNERFYRNTGLGMFGVPFVSTLDFVAQSYRIPLYREAIVFFLKNGDATSAWTCLVWMKRDGVEARDVRDLQESVGDLLATHDFELFPEGDSETRIRSYTGGNRWFVKFALAYAGRWQVLQPGQLLKNP